MQPKRTRRSTRLTLLSLMVVGSVALAGPAQAQTVTTTSNAAGQFARQIAIPANAAIGVYRLTATCVGQVYPAVPGGVIALPDTLTRGDSFIASGFGCSPTVTVTLNLTQVTSAGATFTLAQTTDTRTFADFIRVVADPTLPPIGPIVPTNPPVAQPAAQQPIVITNNNANNNNNSASAVATAGGGSFPVGQQLVRTGVDALPLAAMGTAIMLLGFVLLTAGNRSRPAFGKLAD